MTSPDFHNPKLGKNQKKSFLSSLGTLKFFGIFVLFIVLLSGSVSGGGGHSTCFPKSSKKPNKQLVKSPDNNGFQSPQQIGDKSDEKNSVQANFKEALKNSPKIFRDNLSDNFFDEQLKQKIVIELATRYLYRVLESFVQEPELYYHHPNQLRIDFELGNEDNMEPLSIEEVQKIKVKIEKIVIHVDICYQTDSYKQALDNLNKLILAKENFQKMQ